MPNHTITEPHAKGETPYAVVTLTPNDLERRDWQFLQEWANNLEVTLQVLLHRILVAAIIGQLYVEKIPELETVSCVSPATHEARSVVPSP